MFTEAAGHWEMLLVGNWVKRNNITHRAISSSFIILKPFKCCHLAMIVTAAAVMLANLVEGRP